MLFVLLGWRPGNTRHGGGRKGAQQHTYQLSRGMGGVPTLKHTSRIGERGRQPGAPKKKIGKSLAPGTHSSYVTFQVFVGNLETS